MKVTAKKSNVPVWLAKSVKVADLKPYPDNFKIATELGMQRLQQSLNSFGSAGTIIINTDNTVIDGHSRVEQAKERGEKTIMASYPNRKLTSAEVREMNATFDASAAGEIDHDRIAAAFADTDSFFDKWGFPMPTTVLESMGKNASTIVQPGKNGAPEKAETSKSYTVHLAFTDKEEQQFRAMEEKLMIRYKTITTIGTVLKAMKDACK